ncbi:hypothetical protein FDP41_004028 [Naegleria fowleri]|uniref:Uncharacterized protein n=1 Tax=Naegleria fowleri TaxID=5763 RepID=A0A6A5BFW6_NAEFO|nr:uncharacterized protein FDP41_004028 [Naegleria fowleri]KAF0976733.1 hypothetical protein FDP41_004028 [Naegleria fowleri]
MIKLPNQEEDDTTNSMPLTKKMKGMAKNPETSSDSHHPAVYYAWLDPLVTHHILSFLENDPITQLNFCIINKQVFDLQHVNEEQRTFFKEGLIEIEKFHIAHGHWTFQVSAEFKLLEKRKNHQDNNMTNTNSPKEVGGRSYQMSRVFSLDLSESDLLVRISHTVKILEPSTKSEVILNKFFERYRNVSCVSSASSLLSKETTFNALLPLHMLLALYKKVKSIKKEKVLVEQYDFENIRLEFEQTTPWNGFSNIETILEQLNNCSA